MRDAPPEPDPLSLQGGEEALPETDGPRRQKEGYGDQPVSPGEGADAHAEQPDCTGTAACTENQAHLGGEKLREKHTRVEDQTV